MPITISAKRALRKDRKRNLVNNRIRLKLRKSIKSFRLDPSVKDLSHVYSVIDTAAKKNIIHKNKAARLKSQLSKLRPNTPPQPKTKASSTKKKTAQTKKTSPKTLKKNKSTSSS